MESSRGTISGTVVAAWPRRAFGWWLAVFTGVSSSNFSWSRSSKYFCSSSSCFLFLFEIAASILMPVAVDKDDACVRLVV